MTPHHGLHARGDRCEPGPSGPVVAESAGTDLPELEVPS